ncbi:MAG: hypothetical protein ACO1NQ_03270 [Flavobacteriales bacterium]
MQQRSDDFTVHVLMISTTRLISFLYLSGFLWSVEAQNPPPVWVTTFPTPNEPLFNAISMSVDGMGNSYQLGTADQLQGAVVTKVGPDGALEWQNFIPDGNANGDIYVCPSGAIAVTIGVPDGYFIARYTNDGDLLWTATYYNGGSLYTPVDLAVGPDGALHITGDSYGQTGWDATTVVYDSLGSFRWAERYDHDPSSFGDHGRAIAVDGSGNTYVTGASVDEVEGSIMLISYSPSGEQRWVRRTSPGYQSWAAAIAISEQQHVIIAGRYDGQIHGDFLCAAYDTTGNGLWTTIQDISFEDKIVEMALDANGNIYLVGKEHDSGAPDIALLALSPEGEVRWTRTFGSLTGADVPVDIKIDMLGHVYIAGYGPDDAMNGAVATITLQYDTDGNLIWTGKYYNIETSTTAFPNSIGLDNGGNIYVFGEQCGLPLACSFFVLKYGWDVGITESAPGNDLDIRTDLLESSVLVNLSENLIRPFELTLLDIGGRHIQTAHSSQRTLTLDISQVQSGLYLLIVEDGTGNRRTAKILRN